MTKPTDTTPRGGEELAAKLEQAQWHLTNAAGNLRDNPNSALLHIAHASNAVKVALESASTKGESLEALEAAVEERLKDLRRIKAEGIAERRGAKEMTAQAALHTCEWFLKLIADAKAQDAAEGPKE